MSAKKRTSEDMHASDAQQDAAPALRLENDETPAAKRTKTSVTPTNVPSEESVGITEFLSNDTVPFSARLKERFSDFVVQEIDPTGAVAQLTDLNVPESIQTKKVVSAESMDSSQLQQLVDEGASKLQSEFSVSSESIDEIRQLIAAPAEEAAKMEVNLPGIDDKVKRSALHETFKTYFPQLVTDTVNTSGGQRMIRVRTKKGAQANKSGFDVRSHQWPRDRPLYLRFILYKENFETSNVINTISKKLSLNKKLFAMAGTKDKRGITTQYVTAFKVQAEKIASINDRKDFRGIRVGNFSYVRDQLRLGCLRGNRFGIVLRDVQGITDEQLSRNVEAVKANGFINYFGMQRFGISADVPTYQTGIYMLKRDYEKAFRSILLSRASTPQIKNAIDGFFENGDVRQAVSRLPGFAITEKVILNAYASSGKNNFVSALFGLPRTTRTMYVHSFQSLVWNSLVSERMRKYGLKPVKGDLVLTSKDALLGADDDAEVEEAEPEAAAEASSASDSADDKHAQIENKLKVIESDEEASKYSIEDVVMPLPGGSVQFPTHDIGKARYADFMSLYGITFEDLAHDANASMTHGAYRSVVAKPADVEYSIKHYDDNTIPLITTDWDRLQVISNEGQPNGSKKALVIYFSLPSSTYATMFVRELARYSSELMSSSAQQEAGTVSLGIQQSASSDAAAASSPAAPDTMETKEE